jgi:dihydroorotase
LEVKEMALLLKGGRVVDPQVGLDGSADVLVADNGTIAAVGEVSAEVSAGAQVVDCTGLVVTPGLVDIHVHFRDPGQEYKETIEGGCRSAAKGGYTDVCTMPNTKPVCDTGAVVTYQLAKAAAAGLTRVHPIGALTKGEAGESLAELGDMAAAGACAFSDDGRGVQSAGMLRCAMDYAAPLGRCVISHCQDESLVGAGVVNEGAASTRLGLAGWPAEGEELQVGRDILLSELTGCPLHVAHVSTARGVQMVRAAKERGAQVTCEVTPHHLLLCEDDITDAYDTNYKMNPPLRTRDDMCALRAALADGTIDCVVSDHAPHAAHEKALEFERAPFGIVGLELELPLVLTYLVNTGELSWSRLVDAFCVKPRQVCRLDAVRVEPGCEATLTVIDPSAPFTAAADFLESAAKNTPFIGHDLAGRAMYAYVAGTAILENGEVVSR